jgi:hypothetical protein
MFIKYEIGSIFSWIIPLSKTYAQSEAEPYKTVWLCKYSYALVILQLGLVTEHDCRYTATKLGVSDLNVSLRKYYYLIFGQNIKSK